MSDSARARTIAANSSSVYPNSASVFSLTSTVRSAVIFSTALSPFSEHRLSAYADRVSFGWVALSDTDKFQRGGPPPPMEPPDHKIGVKILNVPAHNKLTACGSSRQPHP